MKEEIYPLHRAVRTCLANKEETGRLIKLTLHSVLYIFNIIPPVWLRLLLISLSQFEVSRLKRSACIRKAQSRSKLGSPLSRLSHPPLSILYWYGTSASQILAQNLPSSEMYSYAVQCVKSEVFIRTSPPLPNYSLYNSRGRSESLTHISTGVTFTLTAELRSR
jgi:hypothetical protein